MTMLKAGDTSPAAQVLLSDGSKTGLGALASQAGRTLLVFLRHFG